jgi:hypothetical protein
MHVGRVEEQVKAEILFGLNTWVCIGCGLLFVTPNLECWVLVHVSCNVPDCNVYLVGLAMEEGCDVAFLSIITV